MCDMPQESQVDESIEFIDKQIQELQEQIQRLTEKKRKLEDQKNKIKELKYLKKSFELSSQDWDKETYSWSKSIKIVLRDTFKLKEFRPQQLRAINATLSNNDVILVAPTGGGKSLCYQLPAVMTAGLTVVVSPLISLMEDQIENLKKFRIEAAFLSTSTDKATEKNVYNKLTNHDFANPLKLLYITPERMSKSKRFMSALQKCYLAKHLDRFAIDEVHCCSQWGHDFRPDYKFLGSLKTTFPDVPILGVTATATNKVLMDVQKILSIRHSLVIRAPFNRPNLYYHVMEKPSEKQATVDLIANLLKTRYKDQSGIIYTYSVRDTEELASSLLNMDVKVRPYHGTLDNDNRSRIHKKWLDNQIQAVVATIAFGMGIDKPDVRFVIHHTISKSMENFYQESGRAGRDGKPAECLLLYRFQDMFKITTMMFSEYTGLKNAYETMRYCISADKCRRDVISKYFAEVWQDTDCSQMCDYCYYKKDGEPPKISVGEYVTELQELVNLAETLELRLTAIKLVDAWYQRGPVTLRLKNKPAPALDRSYAEQILAYCLLEGFLQEDFHYTAYKTNSYLKLGSATPKGDETLRLNKIRYRDLPPAKAIQNAANGFTNDSASSSKRSSKGRVSESTANESLNLDSSEEEIVFVPITPSKKKKSKKSKRAILSDSSSDESRTKKEKRKRKSSTSANLIVKSEIIIDDEIEIVDDKSIFINLV